MLLCGAFGPDLSTVSTVDANLHAAFRAAISIPLLEHEVQDPGQQEETAQKQTDDDTSSRLSPRLALIAAIRIRADYLSHDTLTDKTCFFFCFAMSRNPAYTRLRLDMRFQRIQNVTPTPPPQRCPYSLSFSRCVWSSSAIPFSSPAFQSAQNSGATTGAPFAASFAHSLI